MPSEYPGSDAAFAPSLDCVLPFWLRESGLKGRLVRLGPSISDILSRHDYPAPVAALLAEALTLAALLSHMLKFEGVFTLQVKGDDAVQTLVVDVTTSGHLRGYATFDPKRVEIMKDEPEMALFGRGYIAFTVDQGEAAERYQGIVELQGPTLAAAVQHYFRQSEQIHTGIIVSTRPVSGDGHRPGWLSSGLLMQKLPEATPANMAEEDHWRRAMLLMGSVTADEMLDPALEPSRLLYRLFHAEGLETFPPQPLRDKCRCSQLRVERTLAALPDSEVAHFRAEGQIRIRCEFCAREYHYDAQAIERLYKNRNLPDSLPAPPE